MTTNKYDVAIIGAGIGGLICAARLAKHGKKVILLEKNGNVGGCCSGFKRGEFIFDVGAHVFGSCASDQILGRVLSSIGVDFDFIRMLPTDIIRFPGLSLRIPNSVEDYAETLSTMFRDEARINEFFYDVIDRIKFPRTLYSRTYQDVLDCYFTNPELKAILSAQCGYLGINPNRASAYRVSMAMASYLRDGSFYPKGGAQCFADRIRDAYVSYGGNLLTNTEIVRVDIDNSLIKSIAGQGEESYEATDYVFNIDPLRFARMICPDEHAIGKFRHRITMSRRSPSLFILYLGLRISRDDLNKIAGWHFSTYDLNDQYNDTVFVGSPTLYDTSRCSDNKNIIEIFKYAEYTTNDNDQWHRMKDNFKSSMLSKFGINSNEILAQETASPKSVERYTGNIEGAAYGWENSAVNVRNGRFLPLIDGLDNAYMAGHWTYYGGGIVPVSMSGADAANMILNRFSHRSRMRSMINEGDR